jgi:hypothetical protein
VGTAELRRPRDAHTADGYEYLEGDEVVFRIHPTHASVPGGKAIIGNFLVDGDHWRKLREEVEERRLLLRGGIAGSLLELVHAHLPELKPRSTHRRTRT